MVRKIQRFKWRFETSTGLPPTRVLNEHLESLVEGDRQHELDVRRNNAFRPGQLNICHALTRGYNLLAIR